MSSRQATMWSSHASLHGTRSQKGGRGCLRSTQLGCVAMPGVRTMASGILAHFSSVGFTSGHGHETPCGRGARCCHRAVRSVGPSMAHTDWGLAHTRRQTAGRLSHSPSLGYSAVRDGYERTRRGTVPGGLRGGLRSGGSGPALLLSRT